MSDDTRGRTEVVPEVVFLGKLVERVAAGKIRVPRFQRAFVWNQADLHALLDSILRGFPIGSILVWDTEETIETTGRVGPVEVSPRPDGLVSYLLDGQQRVSTLVGTLRLTDDVKSIMDQVDWRVYCDLDNREFLRVPTEAVEPQHFPVRSLLNTAGFFSACRRIESEIDDQSRAQRWLDEADRLANAFRDYQLPLIHIREADLDSAITVFARLNRKGRKMTADEMISALTYKEGQFHLAKKLDELKEELDGEGFGKSRSRPPSQGRACSPRPGYLRQGLGGSHGQAGGPGQASGSLRHGDIWNQRCTRLSEGTRRYVRSIAALWTPACATR